MDVSTPEPLNRTLRLHFLSDLTALESLCRAESLVRLETATEYMSPRDKGNFLRGYRLAVATTLNSLLDYVARNADSLGLEYDDRLSHWLSYGSHDSGVSVLSAVTDVESDLALMCSGFDSLFGTLRSSDQGFGETFTALKRCGEFGSILRAALGRCEVVSLSDGSRVADGDSLLPVLIAERVVDYTWLPSHFIPLAFQLVWGGEDEFRPLNDESTLDAQTHLDGVSSWPFGRRIPERWWDGLYFGFDSVIRMEGISLPSHASSNTEPFVDSRWFKELQHFVNPTHPGGSWPSMEYGLAEFTEFSKPGLLEYLSANYPVDIDSIPAEERLAAILGPDTVRLFTPGSLTDFMDLEILVAGAVATYPDSLVEMLLVTHSVESDGRDWVSIAVRSRRETHISNHSKWYLFYKLFHEGFVTDSDVGRAIKEIEGLLVRFKDKLHIVEEIDGVSGRDLLSHCELPAFEAMRKLSKRAVDVNSKLRGALAELLASYWLQAQGYSNVKVSLKRASLGDYEYDVLGVKDGECLVVEVKSGDVLDRKLQEHIARLAHKVEYLRGRLPALSKALGYEGYIERVSGLFISLADLKDFEPADTSVTLWDYDGFLRRLRGLELNPRLVGLLDRSHIVHSITDFDLINDHPEVSSQRMATKKRGR